jgi:hypothetical protein
MKKIISFYLVGVAFQLVGFAQCGINQIDLRDKYCKGSYLVHSEYYNSSPKVQISLKAGNKYAIYLLNPSHPISRFGLSDSHNKGINLVSRQNSNFALYTFVPIVSDTYFFAIDFGTNNEACVLWTIYLQNENNIKAGVYKDFEEFKYNNPSLEFNFPLTAKSRKYNKDQYNFYSPVIDATKAKTIGRVLGFSDGKNFYINDNKPLLRSGSEFVKVEFMDRYYYYEEVVQVPVTTGTTVIIVPKLVQKIMDMNTGEITIVNKKRVEEIISDNPQLLKEFENDSQKNKNLKEYLSRYLHQKFDE